MRTSLRALTLAAGVAVSTGCGGGNTGVSLPPAPVVTPTPAGSVPGPGFGGAAPSAHIYTANYSSTGAAYIAVFPLSANGNVAPSQLWTLPGICTSWISM